jgi:hypothetical protein
MFQWFENLGLQLLQFFGIDRPALNDTFARIWFADEQTRVAWSTVMNNRRAPCAEVARFRLRESVTCLNDVVPVG